MNTKQMEGAERVLRLTISEVKKGHVEWFALSVRYTSGATTAVHSEDAPNRPRGLSG